MGLIPEQENPDGIEYSIRSIETMQAKCKVYMDKLIDNIPDAEIHELDVKDRIRLGRDMMSQFAYMEQTKISLVKQSDLSKRVGELEEIIEKIPKEIILKYGIATK